MRGATLFSAEENAKDVIARDAKLRLGAVLQSRLESTAHFPIRPICWIPFRARSFGCLPAEPAGDPGTKRPGKENLARILRRKSVSPCSSDGRFRSSATGNRGYRKDKRLSDKT